MGEKCLTLFAASDIEYDSTSSIISSFSFQRSSHLAIWVMPCDNPFNPHQDARHSGGNRSLPAKSNLPVS
jgi:hypothetical protein